MVASYGRMLTWVLAHQNLDVDGEAANGTLVVTALLYVLISQGLFPGHQDTGVIQKAWSGGYRDRFLLGHGASRQQAAGDRDHAEFGRGQPLVVHRPSMAATRTLNTGRMLINLKPKDERKGTGH